MNNAERRKVEATVAALDREMVQISEVVRLRLDEVESIRGPLAQLLATQRRLEADLLRLERELLAIRENIPPVTAATCDFDLPILVGGVRDYRTINSLKAPEWAKRALLATMPCVLSCVVLCCVVLCCVVLWCGVVCCVVVWCGVVCCVVVWCGVVWCGVVWCGVVWCGGAVRVCVRGQVRAARCK
jgi:hypothetical protein